MEIREHSYYDHDEHGRVEVLYVNNGVVAYEKQTDDYITGGKRFQKRGKQSAAGFQDDATPADLTVSADAAVFDIGASKQ